MAHGNKLSDQEVLKIYKLILEKKEKYGVPYSLAVRTFGFEWTQLKERISKINEDYG